MKSGHLTFFFIYFIQCICFVSFIYLLHNLHYMDIYLPLCRLDNLILEAISTLKEPGGSNRTTIATFIEVIIFSS